MARSVVTNKGRAVRLEGLAELQAKMAAIIDRTTGKEVKRVYMGAALVLRDEARDLAPVLEIATPRRVPGLLRKAIYAAYGDPEKANVLVAVNYKIAPHAWLVEFGGKNMRSTKKGENRGISPAQPFMRPALTTVRAKCVAIIAEGMRGIIEKAAQ